jgi:hypothetical protein
VRRQERRRRAPGARAQGLLETRARSAALHPRQTSTRSMPPRFAFAM